MKFLLPFAALLFAACETTPVTPSAGVGGGDNVRYRYTNTLNLGNDMTMDRVSVTGYDDEGVMECTRLEVSVNLATLTLKSINEGNAMYTPSVEMGPGGTLVVAWGEIDDGGCRVRIAQNPDGSLAVVERKELDHAAGRR